MGWLDIEEKVMMRKSDYIITHRWCGDEHQENLAGGAVWLKGTVKEGAPVGDQD